MMLLIFYAICIACRQILFFCPGGEGWGGGEETLFINVCEQQRESHVVLWSVINSFVNEMTLLRIDYCDERLYYKEGDISELKGAIFINDISIENPDFSLLHDMILPFI